MLASMQDTLKVAQRGKYAICSFNVYNYETMKGVIDAANRLKTPIIIALGDNYLHQLDMRVAYAMTSALAIQSDVQLVLHLDHCCNVDTVYQAIDAGFTSVMYDGSALCIEENIYHTSKVVEYAHRKGVSVEGELGTLETGSDTNEIHLSDKLSYTDPVVAQDFVAKTNVDALAVSIGTVHGLYKSTPNIRVDILKSIYEQVDVPLVLHGGSGTSENKIIQCIQNGIRKININTDISVYTTKGLAALLSKDKLPHLSVVSQKETELVTIVAEKYINLLRYGR